MKYLLIKFDGDEFWIEVGEDNIATRQITKSRDNSIEISCKDDCLAECEIVIEDIDGEIIEISYKEFEEKWNNQLEKYKARWEFQKGMYPIGNVVVGAIKYFYPQGTILQIGEAQGVTSELSGGYPLQTIQGRVKGYDEKNMWLIIDLL